MKKTGRQIVVFFVMLMVASMTMLSAQAVKPRDLQTELTKFWPDSTVRNQNVWQLFPVEVSEIDIFNTNFNCGVRKQFIIKAFLGGYNEEFRVSDQSTGVVEFDSDIYKQTFDKTAPTVKGLVFYLNSKYHPKDTYVGIIFDDRIITENLNKTNGKDEFDEPIYKVNQADFVKVNNRDMESRGTYDTGIPIIKYGKNKENDGIVSPNMVVKVFAIGHPIGNFMEAHQGQKIEQVRLGAIDQSLESVIKIVKEFPNDYFYPVSIPFVFNDKKKEFYSLYKTSSNSFLLVSRDFIMNWQP